MNAFVDFKTINAYSVSLPKILDRQGGFGAQSVPPAPPCLRCCVSKFLHLPSTLGDAEKFWTHPYSAKSLIFVSLNKYLGYKKYEF